MRPFARCLFLRQSMNRSWWRKSNPATLFFKSLLLFSGEDFKCELHPHKFILLSFERARSVSTQTLEKSKKFSYYREQGRLLCYANVQKQSNHCADIRDQGITHPYPRQKEEKLIEREYYTRRRWRRARLFESGEDWRFCVVVEVGMNLRTSKNSSWTVFFRLRPREGR